MTNREKFLDFVNSRNDFSSKYGIDRIYEFVFFKRLFGIVKETTKLKSGTICVQYVIYLIRDLNNKTDFIFVSFFHELKNAEKALEALTLID